MRQPTASARERGKAAIRNGQPRKAPKQKEKEETEVIDTPLQPPFGRRVIFLWSTGGLLFPGCYLASKLINSGRNRIGVALIITCYVLFACGLALIVLSGFTWSWGWWL